jgi:prepilin-type N-terminal cleavage/methylation domain-containing protein
MFRKLTKRTNSDESGFTLVEIVVAMLILALISIALLPLLITGVQQSSRSAAIASAVQLANSQMDIARAQTASCSAITAMPAVTVSAASVYRGVPLSVSKVIGTCPSPAPSASAPGTISVTVTVTRTDTNVVLATASTLIYVTAG